MKVEKGIYSANSDLSDYKDYEVYPECLDFCQRTINTPTDTVKKCSLNGTPIEGSPSKNIYEDNLGKICLAFGAVGFRDVKHLLPFNNVRLTSIVAWRDFISVDELTCRRKMASEYICLNSIFPCEIYYGVSSYDKTARFKAKIFVYRYLWLALFFILLFIGFVVFRYSRKLTKSS